MKTQIYADNAATTKLDIDAFEAMKPFLTEEYGNASQLYSFARLPKKAIRAARETIASCINAEPDEILFTSCGTESDNWAIRGAAAAMKEKMTERSVDAGNIADDTAKNTEEKNDASVADLSITVIANGRPYTLSGKQQYVFVDIFDKLDFDLKASNGRNIVTLLNGRDAQYLEPLKDGDVIEVRWETLK